MEKYHHTTLQDCAQASTIGSIQQLLEQLSTLQLEERQERREAEKRIISALEKIADQGARIAHLECVDTELKQNVDTLYDRQRELEKCQLEEDPRMTAMYTFYQITTNKYALGAGIILLSLLLIGTLNDMVYHTVLFNSIITKLYTAFS
jgi:hypothetical protein